MELVHHILDLNSDKYFDEINADVVTTKIEMKQTLQADKTVILSAFFTVFVFHQL